ncbi:MAG: TIGR04086 family membrane protein [Oscillospiraceae bacterium]|jgi:putative membrane protein (TIGR04086 family)|nr:TIGR04086 family membrane protein [Oscillospiraceae bacterium]
MGKEKREQAHLMDAFLRMILGGGLGLAVCLFLLGVGALAASKGWFPATMLSRICMAGCFLGGFFGGLLALRGGQGKTLLVGLGTAIVFFLFLLVAGVILYRDISPLETGWTLLVSALIGGALSGLVAARPKRRKYS